MVLTMRNNPVYDSIAMVVVLLMAVGTVFVFSASANIGPEIDLQKFYEYASLRQILFFPLACIVMYIFSHLNYRRLSLDNGWLRNPTVYLLVLSIVLLAIVLSQRFYPVFPQFVPDKVRFRWINVPLGPIAVSFQPSELAKWAVIFFLAAVCDKFRDGIRQYWRGFVPVCLVVGVVVALVIVEDFGTAAFIALLAFLMLIIAGVKWWHILTLLPFGAAAFTFMLISSPTRMKRIGAFLEPEKWTGSASYQASQSLIALGSGGLWGKGLGRGICKYDHLPEDTTDFIFAIIRIGKRNLQVRPFARGYDRFHFRHYRRRTRLRRKCGGYLTVYHARCDGNPCRHSLQGPFRPAPGQRDCSGNRDSGCAQYRRSHGCSADKRHSPAVCQCRRDEHAAVGSRGWCAAEYRQAISCGTRPARISISGLMKHRTLARPGQIRLETSVTPEISPARRAQIRRLIPG